MRLHSIRFKDVTYVPLEKLDDINRKTLYYLRDTYGCVIYYSGSERKFKAAYR